MTFVITASRATGARRRFEVEAPSASQAPAAALPLLEPRETILSVEEGSRPRRVRPLPKEEVAELMMDLSELLSIGNRTFNDALAIMVKERRSAQTASMLNRMLIRANQGAAPSANFQAEHGLLGDTCVALASQGDTSKKLPQALETVTNILDREIKQKAALVTALAMPAISASFLVIIFIAATLFLMPLIRDQMDSVKPSGFSALMFGLSDMMREYWYVWAPVVAAAIFVFVRVKSARRLLQRIFFENWTLARRAFQTGLEADFCIIFGSMAANRVTNAVALRISAQRFRSLPLAAQLERTAADVDSGAPVQVALAAHCRLSHRTLSAFEIGQQTNNLGPHLLRYAERLYARSDRAFGVFSRTVTMVIVLAVAGSLLALYVAFYTPILESLRGQMNSF
jgi:type II secretory pathway component PulF